MALLDIATEVNRVLARGEVYDIDEAKTEIWRAHRHYERKYNLTYMQDISKTVPIVAGTKQYGWGFDEEIKRINQIWRETEDGYHIELPVINRVQIVQATESFPQAVLLNGRNGFVFDNEPAEDFILNLDLLLYTTRDDDDAATSWLIENADELLLHHAVMRLAAKDADPELFAQHQALERESRDVLLDAELEFEHSGTDGEMLYVG